VISREFIGKSADFSSAEISLYNSQELTQRFFTSRFKDEYKSSFARKSHDKVIVNATAVEEMMGDIDFQISALS